MAQASNGLRIGDSIFPELGKAMVNWRIAQGDGYLPVAQREAAKRLRTGSSTICRIEQGLRCDAVHFLRACALFAPTETEALVLAIGKAGKPIREPKS